jgi:hypothetical protein
LALVGANQALQLTAGSAVHLKRSFFIIVQCAGEVQRLSSCII